MRLRQAYKRKQEKCSKTNSPVQVFPENPISDELYQAQEFHLEGVGSALDESDRIDSASGIKRSRVDTNSVPTYAWRNRDHVKSRGGRQFSAKPIPKVTPPASEFPNVPSGSVLPSPGADHLSFITSVQGNSLLRSTQVENSRDVGFVVRATEILSDRPIDSGLFATLVIVKKEFAKGLDNSALLVKIRDSLPVQDRHIMKVNSSLFWPKSRMALIISSGELSEGPFSFGYREDTKFRTWSQLRNPKPYYTRFKILFANGVEDGMRSLKAATAEEVRALVHSVFTRPPSITDIVLDKKKGMVTVYTLDALSAYRLRSMNLELTDGLILQNVGFWPLTLWVGKFLFPLMADLIARILSEHNIKFHEVSVPKDANALYAFVSFISEVDMVSAYLKKALVVGGTLVSFDLVKRNGTSANTNNNNAQEV